MNQEIETNLIKHIEECLPQHKFKKVIEYAVLPPGKLFRPQLVYSLANDLESLNEDHKFLASSIEIHHAYTLIHDDLPAMDDDDYRRGKQSTHKKFTEAEAILAGDALLNYSYELLSNITPKILPEIIRLYGETTGSRGLILGQVMDLEESDKTLEDVLTIHSLKTSCLIQLSLQGSNLLSSSKLPKAEIMKLGHTLGIVFQLLDDLSELGEEISSHEKEINPYLKFNHSKVLNELTENISLMNDIVSNRNLKCLKSTIDGYLDRMKGKIESHKNLISNYIPELELIIKLLK